MSALNQWLQRVNEAQRSERDFASPLHDHWVALRFVGASSVVVDRVIGPVW
jgi:hypothetical protein